MAERDAGGTATAAVHTPSGAVIELVAGGRLVFGRGPDADVRIDAGRGLSRRAGVISVVADGAWVANISRTHALYTVSDGTRTRLPRLVEPDGPSVGWFVRVGTVLVGSRSMLDDGQALELVVANPDPDPYGEAMAGDGAPTTTLGESTLLPLYLDDKTKLFLVALMWCRPWLLDPSRTTPLPRTPEIARAALEVTDAHYELECFDSDPAYRDRLAARVAEHLKVLRRKISERGLTRPGVRLSDEVVVEVLLEHEVVTVADLARLKDPAWCSRQEDLWWTRRP